MTEAEGPPKGGSGGAVGAPSRHPSFDVTGGVGREAAPTGTPKEPDDFMAYLLEGFESARLEDSHRQEVVRIDSGEYFEFMKAVKEAGFELCSDVTVTDWFRHRRTRFDLVVNLVSLQHRRRLRVLVPLAGEEPTVASITPLWPGMAFGEREAYDMFGVVFEDHPDLTRILMPDEWEGYPLRKDYGTGSVPVQFKESHKVT
ncbi:MAG: NADH-quinone oxidoreductase subunit C [Acidimicrobiia bacterium]